MLDSFTKKCLKLMLIISLTYITYKLMTIFAAVILPFVLAYLFTQLLSPPIAYFHKQTKVPRHLIAPITVTIFLASIGTILYILLRKTIHEATTFIDQVPIMINHSIHIFETVIIPFYEKLSSSFHWLTHIDMIRLLESLQQFALNESMRLFEQIGVLFSSISYVMTSFIIFIIALYIMTMNVSIIKNTFWTIMPQTIYKRLIAVRKNVLQTFFNLFKAQLILSVLTAIISLIGLYVADFQHPFMLSIFILVIDFLPYIGVGTIFLPLIGYQLLIGQMSSTIILLIFYCIILIFRQIIEPKVVGASLGIHPLLVLFIVFATIHLLGIVGVFFIPVILITIAAVHHAHVFIDIWHYIHR